jgi:RNA polymerase sigma factor (TIGR02999 family)
LQPTALVNEAWLHLARSDNLDQAGKTLFLAAAATTFRRLLIDYARHRNAEKRGGGALRVSFEDGDHQLPFADAGVEQLNAALEALESKYPRQHQVVELKYFAGLPVKAIAEIIGVSERTIANDLDFARAWLKSRMAAES